MSILKINMGELKLNIILNLQKQNELVTTEAERFRKWDLVCQKASSPCIIQVPYRIAKAMKPHTLAEEVVKPCVVDMANINLGDGAARKLKQVVLSSDRVRRRINDLSIDIRDQLISELKTSPPKISLQLDKYTDVFNYI